MRVNTRRTFGLLAVVLCLLMLCAAAADGSFAAKAKDITKKKPKGAMATAVGREIAVSWEPVKGAHGYYVYESVNGSKFVRVGITKNLKYCLPVKTRGVTCRYKVRAYTVKTVTVKVPVKEEPKPADQKADQKTEEKDAAKPAAKAKTTDPATASSNTGKVQTKKVKKYTWSKWSRIAYTTTPATGKSTLKNYLRTAVMPLGHTMYIWGGGWNKADTGSGMTTRRTGLYQTWRTFANKQSKWYSYQLHRYEINKGLDCSGFVGWTVYNILQTRNNKPGYVYLADVEGQKYARMGLGTWTKRDRVTERIPGDIMEGDEHIWISLGQCKDGSTVVLHASPPGVKLSGTASRVGARNSQAARLAAKYMKKYYPSWYNRYPTTTLIYCRSYNEDYNRFRWSPAVLSDPDGYRQMSAEQVLADLFGEM